MDIINTILSMEKLKLDDIKQFSQEHTNSTLKSQNMNLNFFLSWGVRFKVLNLDKKKLLKMQIR